MEKKEYCLDFVSKIQNKEKESLYKFFTRNSIIVFLDGFNEIIVPDFVEYIEHNYFDKNINIKRVLESKVANVIPCYVYTANLNNYQPAVIEDEVLKQKIIDFMNWKINSPV